MARIYVSSTFKDLEECREKIRIALKRINHEDIAMEYYVAENKRPLDRCLEDVASCDLYVGIFAWRYGFVPSGYDKSITELEYRKAVETGKKCLIFLLDEDVPWPPKYVDRGKNEKRIKALRKELSDEHIVSFFHSVDEFASLVGPAVRNWEIENRIEPKTAIQGISSNYNPSELPKYPDKLKKFVTENRADELRKALTYLKNHRILLISGVGGVGKSTLARAIIDFRPITVSEPFWFSFYRNKDAKLGDILEKLATYMNDPKIASFKAEKREPGNIDVDRLTGELNRRSEVWLIFDDLSMVLEDQCFIDKGIDFLFSSLRNDTHNAKVIATTRILPILKSGESLLDEDDDEKQHLNGLNKDFAVDYLASNGLEKIGKPDLEKLATGVDVHPLALKLLVKLVRKHGAANILNDLSTYQTEKEDTIKKARNLFNKLAGDEKELLERISVYREPVKWEGLKEMFTENTSKKAINKLIDKSLLETDNKGNYWLHSLIQEFSYEGLKNKKEAHLLAVKYYLSLPLPKNSTKKENLQPAIEALYHTCEAREFDKAVDIIWEFNLHYPLDLWGYTRTLIEIYEKLLPHDHFKCEPILKDKWNHEAVLGDLGKAYSHLGDAKKSIDYSEQALIIAREIGDRYGESRQLGDLGMAYDNLGDAKKAIDYYEQALEISREIGNRQGEGVNLGNIGEAYDNLGDAKKAIDYYEQALKIAREIGDIRNEGIWLGYLGLAYYRLGNVEKSIDYYEQTLMIAREIGDRRGEESWLGNLGIAYDNLGDTKKAIDYYEQALEIAREIGDRRGESNSLGNLGIAYDNLGDTKKAIDYYEQALKINPEDESSWYNKACAYSLMNKKSEALADLKRAIELNPSYKESAKSNKDFEKLWEDRDFWDIIAVNLS